MTLIDAFKVIAGNMNGISKKYSVIVNYYFYCRIPVSDLLAIAKFLCFDVYIHVSLVLSFRKGIPLGLTVGFKKESLGSPLTKTVWSYEHLPSQASDGQTERERDG